VHQLQRPRARFFAMINHELRNAIAGVYGWAEMLVRRKEAAEVPRAAYEVLDSAGQAASLINDLLDLSRLDEHRLKPNLQAVDPATVAGRAVSHVTPAAMARQVEIVVHLETPKLPTCHTDALRVEQILGNVLNNAVRHAPERSTVRLRLLSDPEWIHFRIEDDGPGVPEAELERIFDIYVTKAGEEARGLGLGLPLSRRLARLLSGDLFAEANPGGGGRFTLRLPRQVVL
jgi:signal transduction histidine kinase